MVQVLDKEWFTRLHAIATSTNDLDWLQNSVKVTVSERVRFLEYEVENPLFLVKSEQTVCSELDALRTLKEQVEKYESNEAVRSIYIRKIGNHHLRLEMLQATSAGDDTRFFNYSKQLYGAPRKDFFAYIAKRIQVLCEADVPNDAHKAAERLLQLFSKISTKQAVIDNDVLPEVREDDAKALSSAEVARVFEETLRAYDIDGWEVIVDEEGSRQRFAVNPYRKLVHVPGDAALANRRVPFTPTSAQALAEHEVGVHVRRAHQGSQQPLLLLGLGLDGYLKGEEGLASYVQQQVEGADEFYGFDRYMAISLAVGLDGSPRDFRAVFSSMVDYYTVTLRSRKNIEERARSAAWDVCMRIFRGTTGQSAGTVFTRDLAYFAGNIEMWQFMTDYPERFNDLFIGKFDPLNQEHVTALQSLDILPKW